MCEARLSGLLVLGADVIPQVDRHDGRFVILMHDHGQSVVENELLVRDIDVLGLRKSAGRKGEKQNETNETHDATPQQRVLHFGLRIERTSWVRSLAGSRGKLGLEYTRRVRAGRREDIARVAVQFGDFVIRKRSFIARGIYFWPG
jgi:hypothetical protein